MNKSTETLISRSIAGAIFTLCLVIGSEFPAFAEQRGQGPRPGGGGPHQGGGFQRNRDNNPPGPRGGQGTNWENRPGPQGGQGASPDFRGKGWLEKHPEAMQRMDQNGDGKIGRGERREARDEWREKRKAQFDANKDGKVDDTERQAGREQWLANHPKAAERMQKMDANGDGKVEPEERQAAREAWHTQLLEKLDSNKDGKLDPFEKRAGRQARREQRGDQEQPPAADSGAEDGTAASTSQS